MKTNKNAFRPLGTQKVAYTGTAGVITNAVRSGLKVVRVWCTTPAFIAVGVNPTATVNDMPIAASVPEYINIEGGEKVSAIQQTDDAGGNLYVTEVV